MRMARARAAHACGLMLSKWIKGLQWFLLKQLIRAAELLVNTVVCLFNCIYNPESPSLRAAFF